VVEKATPDLKKAPTSIRAAHGRAPVDKYCVVVTQRHVASWEWEIHRDNEPLTVPLWDGPFESERAAEEAGAVALRELLKTLDQLEDD
jgi:hypothetical protein